MIEEKVITTAKRLFETAKKHQCPECGSIMAEVERVNENGFSFVWYECTQPDCDGQWLAKMSA